MGGGEEHCKSFQSSTVLLSPRSIKTSQKAPYYMRDTSFKKYESTWCLFVWAYKSVESAEEIHFDVLRTKMRCGWSSYDWLVLKSPYLSRISVRSVLAAFIFIVLKCATVLASFRILEPQLLLQYLCSFKILFHMFFGSRNTKTFEAGCSVKPPCVSPFSVFCEIKPLMKVRNLYQT